MSKNALLPAMKSLKWLYVQPSDGLICEITPERVAAAVEHDSFLDPYTQKEVPTFKDCICGCAVTPEHRLIKHWTLQEYLTGLEGL